MSFKEKKKVIENGDTVMLYLGRSAFMAIEIDENKTHQTKFGAFPHKDFIGKRFGTKIYSKNKKGWVYILHPTPELWTVTLPHRTQILYSTDIALITMELELKPGSIVIESGTGSGSLSHAIIRTVKPNGHLYTFDFHEQRVQKAREEFNAHGIGEYVTCGHADACKDGFSLEDKADAVFLDLPAPWDAIPHAKRSLKKSGGRLCSFSPCIEQVQRTCDTLRKHRFCEIKTVECLLRAVCVRTMPFPEVNLGENSLNVSDAKKLPPPNSGDNLLEGKSPNVIKKRRWRKLKKIRNAKGENHDNADSNEQFIVVDTVGYDDSGSEEEELENEEEEPEPESKKIKTADVAKEAQAENKQLINKTEINDISGVNPSGMVTKLTSKTKPGYINFLTSKSNKEMPGHTGYLTFASLYPCWDLASEKK